jgi:hypothetical protein
LVDYVLGNALTGQELNGCIREVVTVMLKHMVLGLTPVCLGFSQEFHKQFLRKLGKPKTHGFRWSTEWRSARRIITNTTAIVELFVVNAYSCVPDTLKVLANKLL